MMVAGGSGVIMAPICDRIDEESREGRRRYKAYRSLVDKGCIPTERETLAGRLPLSLYIQNIS